MDLNYLLDWKINWDEGLHPWHLETIHPVLKKHLQKIASDEQPRKLLLPMCGKTLDMIVLAKMGHSVVGIEFCETAVYQFFADNKITYTTNDMPGTNCIRFECNDLNIKIYCIDILKFNSEWETNFDGVWDRGGLESIDIALRKQYANVMKSIVKTGTHYLLEVRDRPPGIGPPYYVSMTEIVQLFELPTQPALIEYIVPREIPSDGNVSNQCIYYFEIA